MTVERHNVAVATGDADSARLAELRSEFVEKSAAGANGMELRNLREAITGIEQNMAGDAWAQAEADYQTDAAALADEFWRAHDACDAALDRLIDSCVTYNERTECHARDPRRPAYGAPPPNQVRPGDEVFRAAFRAMRRRPGHRYSTFIESLFAEMGNWSPPRKDTQNG